MKRTQKPATGPQQFVKIYDNLTFTSKNLHAFSPIPTLNLNNTIEMHKSYKRKQSKHIINAKNNNLLSIAVQSNDQQQPRYDQIPKPKHAFFDTVQIEIDKLDKAITTSYAKKTIVHSPMMQSRYSTILSEIKPERVGKQYNYQATNADTTTSNVIGRKSVSEFSNAYVEGHRPSARRRLISAHSIQVKTENKNASKNTLKQAKNRRVKSSVKQRSQVFSPQLLMTDDNGYEVQMPQVRIKSPNIMQQNHYGDIKSKAISIGQLKNIDEQSASGCLEPSLYHARVEVGQIKQKIQPTNQYADIQFETLPDQSMSGFQMSANQTQQVNNQNSQKNKKVRYSAQVFKRTQIITGEKALGKTKGNPKNNLRNTLNDLRQSKDIEQMIEYVTTAHKARFDKTNDLLPTHKLKPKSPPAKLVTTVQDTKMSQGCKLLPKSVIKCQNNDHATKKSKMGLQENELILVSKPEDEPPFFNILIEQRHAAQLSKKNLDDESRLEVIYRVLKDQLRRAKKDLLQMKLEKPKQAVDIKERIENANTKSSKKKNSIADEVISPSKGVYQLSETAQVDLSLRNIVNHLISTDVRKHNRYCPCCKTYDEGKDLSQNQMGEFLEYIRQLNTKLNGDPHKNRKKGRPKEYVLDYDSVSDITDLSDQGILTTSMKELSPTEQKRLNVYMRQMRKLQQADAPKHDCLNVKKTLNNSKLVVEMQLRGVQHQNEKYNEANSAHQFSQRTVQLQADDQERDDIQLQTTLIDLKSKNGPIDIYDISKADSYRKPNKRFGFRKTSDQKCGTGEGQPDPVKVKLISTQDWFFSELNRRLLREFYIKNGIQFSQELLDSFKEYDYTHPGFKLTPLVASKQIIEKQRQSLKDTRTSLDRSNPQESILSGTQVICESEITYLTSMMKQDSEKWSLFQVLKELHSKSCTTARMLTKELIEGKTPIDLIISNHMKIDRDSVIKLLYRCEKLFQARSDVQNILLLLLKLNDAPNATQRTPQEHQQLVQKLKGLVGQFKTEFRMYDKTFIYKGRDVDNLADQESDKDILVATARSQAELKDDKKIQGILKTEAISQGAIGLPEGQKISEIQIIDKIAGMGSNQFLQKVKDELQQVRNAIYYSPKADKDVKESDLHFKIQEANYSRHGSQIKRVALLENLIDDQRSNKKRKRANI